MEFTVQNISENFWAIDQDFVRSYLLVGEDSALLVDTCAGGDIKSVCGTITDKPITLVTTHADPDHIGCDEQFPIQYLHPAEFGYYERRSERAVHARPMWEGDVFTVGKLHLEVVLVPGHTPGSVALLERERRFLLAGDTVQSDCVFMHGDGRNLPAYRCAIEKLEKMRRDGLFDTIYAAHGELGIPADVIEDHLTLAETLLNGTAKPVGPAPEFFPHTVKTYRHGRAQMFY